MENRKRGNKIMISMPFAIEANGIETIRIEKFDSVRCNNNSFVCNEGFRGDISMGKKKFLFATILLILCICISSCSKVEETNTDLNAKNESVEGKIEEIIQDEVSENDETILTDVSKVLAGNGETIALKNGIRDETLEAVGADQTNYGNLEVNIKGENNQVLLCKDPVYNIVYYVNYGEDYFIYRIKDGKSELVVELPAKRLFCRDGKLYFMLEGYKIYEFDGMESGNILCYQPITGEITVISKEKAKMMCVYGDGIYYYVDTNGDKMGETNYTVSRKFYYYSFEKEVNSDIETNLFSTYKWRDYFWGYQLKERDGADSGIFDMVGIALQKLEQTESLEILGGEIPEVYSFIGNYLYYMPKDSGITIYNMETQEKHEIPLYSSASNVDFTILNEKIYVNSLVQIDPKTGIQSLIVSEGNQAIKELYTDGEYLYGICSTPEGGQEKLQRIVIEEFPEEAMIIKKDSGESYEVNRFVFHTDPM